MTLYCPKCGEKCKISALDEICPMNIYERCVWCETVWTIKISFHEDLESASPPREER